MTKLTLSVNDDVVEQAKQIAKQNGTSVSAMFGHFVRSLTMQHQGDVSEIPAGSMAARVRGIISLPKDKPSDDVLAEALMDKYGVDR